MADKNGRRRAEVATPQAAAAELMHPTNAGLTHPGVVTAHMAAGNDLLERAVQQGLIKREEATRNPAGVPSMKRLWMPAFRPCVPSA